MNGGNGVERRGRAKGGRKVGGRVEESEGCSGRKGGREVVGGR